MDKNEKKNTNKKVHKTRVIIALAVFFIVVAVGLLFVKMIRKKPNETMAFQIGSEVVYMDEVYLCTLQNLLQLNLDSDALAKEDRNGRMAEQYYKDEIRDVIVNYRVESELAISQGMQLTVEDEKIVKENTAKLMGSISGNAFRELEISSDCLSQVMKKQYLARKFELESVKDITTEREHYCTMYFLLFPKIKTDANGEFVYEEDGATPVLLDEAEITLCKANAESARQMLLDGVEAEEVAKKYGIEVYSGEQKNLASSFDEAFVPYAKKLKEGECSPIVETASCFGIVKMISTQDEDAENQIYAVHEQEEKEEKIIENRKEWFKQFGISDEVPKELPAWKKMTLFDFVKYVEE